MSTPQRAQTFNAKASIYDDVQPSYPEQLYRDIQEYAGDYRIRHDNEISQSILVAVDILRRL